MENKISGLITERMLSLAGIDISEAITYEVLSKYTDIIKGKNLQLNKREQFSKLANLTYHGLGYKSELSSTGLLSVAPNPIFTIKNWRQYTSNEERTKGESVETALTNYFNSVKLNIASHVNAKALDLVIGNAKIEVKSSGGNSINTMLQTSFYSNDPEKFYFFVTNTNKEDIDVTVVSSQLLYMLSLLIYNLGGISSSDMENKIRNEIRNGINSMDFEKQILDAIVSGKSPEGYKKSFAIGSNLSVRFLIYLEPKSNVI